MTSCCCIDTGDDVAAIYSRRDIKRARKAHRCCECRRVIPRGAPYRYETVLFEGRWDSYHTCTLCAAIRDDRFTCGWTWAGLWEDLRYCLEDQFVCGCEDDCDCDKWLDPPTHPIEVTK